MLIMNTECYKYTLIAVAVIRGKITKFWHYKEENNKGKGWCTVKWLTETWKILKTVIQNPV
jgi:hypothetical protein